MRGFPEAEFAGLTQSHHDFFGICRWLLATSDKAKLIPEMTLGPI